MQDGFQLIDVQTGEMIERWPVIPRRIEIPGVLRVDGASVGWSDGNFRIEACSWDEVLPASGGLP